MAQTTVQHPETIRFGSGMLEIGADIDSLVDVGAMTGVKFTHEFTRTSIVSDNAGVIRERQSGQKATIEGNLMEINLDTLAAYLRGVSEIDVVPGVAATVLDEPHVLTGNQFVRLDNFNGDGTLVSDVVVNVGAVLCAIDVDYYLAVDAAGYSCIARNPTSAKITSGATVLVDYGYTPKASKKLHVGGQQVIGANVARITNYNESDEPFSITVYKATADSGISIEFKSDDAEETNVVPIKLVGTLDTTRTLNQQLFTIDDMQD